MKKFLNLLLCVSMIMICLSGLSLVAFAESVTIGDVTIEQDAEGAYIIDSKEKFEAIFSSSNTENQDLVKGGYTFKQTESFTLSSTYAPIREVNFIGTYDGGKNTIAYADNFTLSADNFGLFYTLGGATIKNLTVDGTIDAGAHGTVGGFAYHTASGSTNEFTNCTNSVDITSSKNNIAGFTARAEDGVTFTKCVNEGNISGSDNVGGFQGFAGATYEQCANHGDITASSSVAGGLVGSLGKTSKFNKCANFGIVTALRTSGGIVGSLAASGKELTVKLSYNVGTIKATGVSRTDIEVGGILGRGYYYNKNASTTFTKVFIQNCYNAGDLDVPEKATFSIGSAIGKPDEKGSTYAYTNNHSVENFYDLTNSDVDVIGATKENDATTITLKNAFILYTDSAFQDATTKTKDDLKKPDGNFTTGSWEESTTDYPYIQLKGNPYKYNPGINASVLKGTYVFTGTDTTDFADVVGIDNVNSAYAVIAARFTYNSTLIANGKTYGVLVSKTVENPDIDTCDKKFEAVRNLNGLYGILIHNIEAGTAYYVRPYIEYNGTYCYGTADTFTISE